VIGIVVMLFVMGLEVVGGRAMVSDTLDQMSVCQAAGAGDGAAPAPGAPSTEDSGS
jgi:hypothetical protein